MTETIARSRRASVEDELALTRFLYDEAEAIDNMDFDRWLTFLDENIDYWGPVRENRVYRERKLEIQPKGTSVYFEENKEFLRQRVDRLRTQKAWAEEPASRSRHLVSNVRVDDLGGGSFAVRSNFIVYRTRGERDEDLIAGERRDIIAASADAPQGYLVKERQILFDMATILVKNLSLFY